MRNLLCAVVLLSAVNVWCGPEDMRALEYCLTKLGIENFTPPPDLTNLKEKCIPACVCTEMGRIKDGKIIEGKYLDLAYKLFNKPEKSKVIECIDLGNEQEEICDVPLVAMKCMKDYFGSPTRV